ncbi:hypothetical protein BXZ70DRAFT_637223 [Cristinia sonorae]|uniref:F-box domain-containing protein n=1 Tax=Cristinia sonorae TaxID=1940300 RepID=A0A8K0UED1_9AGAR|nr:hypothetical protein BXZ70DRAFT_637223 [Cristinia sonorae]
MQTLSAETLTPGVGILSDPAAIVDASPITTLPPELLVHLFLCCLHIPNKSFYHDENSSLLPSWTSVTAVCRYWRAVALNTPQLWSQIDVDSLMAKADELAYPTTAVIETVKLLLGRSKRVPLDVQYLKPQTYDTMMPFDFRPILAEFGHIFSLRIGHTEKMVELFTGSNSIHAPLLSRLYILHNGDVAAVASFLTCLDAPSLEELTIITYATRYDTESINWTKSLFPSSLKRLYILYDTLLGADPSTIASTIGHLLHLERLVLRERPQASALFQTLSHSPTFAEPSPLFSLPHLQELSLSGGTASCTHFIEHVRIPAAASVALLLQPRDLRSSIFRPSLLRVLRQRLNPPRNTDNSSLPPVATLVFQSQSVDFHTLDLDGAPEVPPDQPPLFSLSYNNTSRGSDSEVRAFMQQMRQIVLDVPLHNITTLVLRFLRDDEDAAADWIALLGTICNVTTLVLHHDPFSHPTGWSEDAMVSLLRLHTTTTGSDTALSAPGPPLNLPNLKHIFLSNIDLTESILVSGSGSALGSVQAEIVDGLECVLRERKDAGCMVKVLALKECGNVDGDMVQRLGSCVLCMEWDGYIGPTVEISYSDTE